MNSSVNPLFGRKWKLTVTGPANSINQTQQKLVISSEDLSQPLRVTFDIQTVWYVIFWQAVIRIYNLSEDSTQWLLSQGGTASSTNSSTNNPLASAQSPPIQQGMQVTLEAGYQQPGQYGIIWQGHVLQPMFSRENQTDFVVTLLCVVGLNEDSNNFINRPYPLGINPLTMVQQMAADCFHPIPATNIAPSLSSATALSYPKIVFGNPGKHFAEIARSNNKQHWLDGRGFSSPNQSSSGSTTSKTTLNIGGLALSEDFPKTPSYTFTPLNSPPINGSISSIVGTPTQIQYGVECQLLLNPNVFVRNPAMAIAIKNTVIQQLQIQIGDIGTIGILSQDGVYAVIKARYVGDTRGNDWYTYITGWQGEGFLAALAGLDGAQTGQ